MYAKTYRGFRGRWRRVLRELVAHAKPSETILSKQSFGKLLSFAVSSEPLRYLLSCRYNNFSLRELYSTGSKDKLLSVIDFMWFFFCATWLGLEISILGWRLTYHYCYWINFLKKRVHWKLIENNPGNGPAEHTGRRPFNSNRWDHIPKLIYALPITFRTGKWNRQYSSSFAFPSWLRAPYTAWASTNPVAYQHRPGTWSQPGSMHLLVVYLLLPLFDAN